MISICSSASRRGRDGSVTRSWQRSRFDEILDVGSAFNFIKKATLHFTAVFMLLAATEYIPGRTAAVHI